MGDFLRVGYDDSSAIAFLDGLVEASNVAVRPAAQAGAQILYDEARIRCPVSADAHFFYGTSYKKTGQRYFFEPGSLRASIYQVYSVDNSSETRATYHVAWNHQKVPYGFMVEFGTSRAPAKPFLRPAWESAHIAAIDQALNTYAQLMSKVLQ
jgi:HK97 gp10 family phage protein